MISSVVSYADQLVLLINCVRVFNQIIKAILCITRFFARASGARFQISTNILIRMIRFLNVLYTCTATCAGCDYPYRYRVRLFFSDNKFTFVQSSPNYLSCYEGMLNCMYLKCCSVIYFPMFAYYLSFHQSPKLDFPKFYTL